MCSVGQKDIFDCTEESDDLDCGDSNTIFEYKLDGNVLDGDAQDSHHPQSFSDAQQFVAEIRHHVWSWTWDWGPTANWHSRLQKDFQKGGVNAPWLDECESMLNIGRELLRALWHMAETPVLVKEEEMGDILRQVFELSMVVQGGVACLEAWMRVGGRLVN